MGFNGVQDDAMFAVFRVGSVCQFVTLCREGFQLRCEPLDEGVGVMRSNQRCAVDIKESSPSRTFRPERMAARTPCSRASGLRLAKTIVA